MIRHMPSPKGDVIFDHRHNAADRATSSHDGPGCHVGGDMLDYRDMAKLGRSGRLNDATTDDQGNGMLGTGSGS